MAKVWLKKGMELEVKEAWGEWLEGMADWRLFATLTMRDKENRHGETYSPGLYQARDMWQGFQEQCRLYSSEVDWVAVYELQPGREVYHTHALVAGPFERGIPGALSGLRAWCWETWGFNKVEKFKPSVGASGYLGRYLVKGGTVDFSPSLSRG